MNKPIHNLSYAISLAGDGCMKPFTDEEEDEMINIINSIQEILNINPKMLVDEYYPQDIGFIITAEGQKRYCERKAFIKGIKLCQTILCRN